MVHEFPATSKPYMGNCTVARCAGTLLLSPAGARWLGGRAIMALGDTGGVRVPQIAFIKIRQDPAFAGTRKCCA